MSFSVIYSKPRTRAPNMPCWYCNGQGGEGEVFSQETHNGWDCEACEERERLTGFLTMAQSQCKRLRSDNEVLVNANALLRADHTDSEKALIDSVNTLSVRLDKADALRQRSFRSGYTTAVESIEEGATLEDLKSLSFYDKEAVIPPENPDHDEDDDVDDEAWDP